MTNFSRIFFTRRRDDLLLLGREIFIGPERTLVSLLLASLGRGEPFVVITPNVDQVLRLSEDLAWESAFCSADLLIADGMPLILVAKAIGLRSATRHTGADLLPLLASLSAVRGLRLAIVGGSELSRERARENLTKVNQGLQLRTFDLPHIEKAEDPSSAPSVTALRTWQPDFVFVCLGSPKQELWIEAWRDQLPPAVYIGAGAAVDFAAGTVSRAPVALQRLSLEWLWRLASDPRRLAYRYLVRGPKFALVAGRSVWNFYRSGRPAAQPIDPAPYEESPNE